MKTRVLIPAILSAVMLSVPVLAASSSPTSSVSTHKMNSGQSAQKLAAMTLAERCTALEHQLDGAIKAHSTSAKIKDVKAMRSEGGSLCASGKQIDGTQKLEQALKVLGESPKS